MAILNDTSVLGRLANMADAAYAVANNAIVKLHAQGELLNLFPQVLVEFRSMATRPANVNGLDLSVKDTEFKAAGFEAKFPLLPETPDIFPAWKAIVSALGVIGKQVHDARLVAACHVHQVTHLLTFNVSHFARLASPGPPLTVIHPANV